MAELATVKIVSDKSPSGFVIINEKDFDREQHRLYEGRMLGAGNADQEAVEPEADADPAAELMKLTKAELVTKATEAGHEVVPDEMTKKQLVDKILGTGEGK